MNRLYVIRVGFLEIRGLISPGEHPDLLGDFFRLSNQHGACAEYLCSGQFRATKNGVRISLTIGSYHEAIPGPMLLDALDAAMEMAF